MSIRKKIGTLLVSLLIGFIVNAQSFDLYKKEIFVKESDTLQYRILWPVDFDKNKKYPVVLFLHGAGERGIDNSKQLVHGSKLFLKTEFRKKHPAIVIFPQCPESDYWSNITVDRSKNGREKFSFQYGETPNTSLGLVIDMMDEIISKSYTKEDQIYIGGLSMGGMGTFEMLYRRPNMFAAAMIICGGGDPDTVNKYAKTTSLWIFHGAKDNVVAPSFSLDMAQAVLKAGGFPKVTLYDNANHNSWDPAFSEPDLLSWLFSHQLDNNSK